MSKTQIDHLQREIIELEDKLEIALEGGDVKKAQLLQYQIENLEQKQEILAKRIFRDF